MIDRFISQQLRKSKKSILLLGPRQVGKSTLLESLKPDLIINLANEEEFLKFTTNPGELEARIAEADPRSVLVDEVQRLPSLLNTIQVLIDKNKQRRFYLSGSSARKLRRGSANLLPGRLFNYRLGPLSCLELDFKMDTVRALEVGSLPEAYTSERADSEKLLRSYTATYLREEILAEALTRQIQGFSRFLQTAAENSGRLLDFSKLASQSKVNRSAARRFYELLEDTLICDRVDAYPSDQANLVKHPKYFFFDNGIVNGVLGNFKASADRKGLLMEHLFFNQLKNTSYC
jgi:predicted AAA+ superfamily ATPase